MAYNDFKNKLEGIFATCIVREKKLDCKIQELENRLQFENFMIQRIEKKVKTEHHDSPQQINCDYQEAMDALNGKISMKNSVSNKEKTIIQSTAALQKSYNPTPVSTKMNIRNVLKDKKNLQTKDPVIKLRKNLMDAKKPQDDSTNSFIKLPPLIPKVEMRRNITFDDLETDDEQPKGNFPKWSSPRRCMKKLKLQTFVDLDFVASLFLRSPFSNDYVSSKSMFPTSNPINLKRNESSIWEDED